MLIYVGSYTSDDRNGRGKGITVFRSAPVGNLWRHVQTLTTYDNPSLLRIAPGGRVLYAVHGGRSRVSAFTVEPDGQLAAFGSVGSGGENPVDIGFLAEGRFLVVASYTSGTVGLVRVGPDGAPQDLCQIITLERPGYDAGRPLVSMPHGVAICPEGNFVLIPNKGLDCVFVFRFDPAGQLVPADVPAPGTRRFTRPCLSCTSSANLVVPCRCFTGTQQPGRYMTNRSCPRFRVWRWATISPPRSLFRQMDAASMRQIEVMIPLPIFG
jgi:6-phosphogluconolactonase